MASASSVVVIPPPRIEVQQEGDVIDAAAGTVNFTGAVSLLGTVPGAPEVDVPGFQGLLRSPDGGCWKITLDNTGTPTYTKVDCPDAVGPSVDVGGVLTATNNHQSTGNPINSPGGNVAVTAGKLLVVACVHGSTVGSPATSVSDSAGNVWTEHSSGWDGSDPDNTYLKVAVYTAIANATGLTEVTVHQDGAAATTASWVMYEINGHNGANPIGTHGAGTKVAHSAVSGETYSNSASTVGTPAPNSLIIAVSANLFINGFQPPDPSVYTDDPAFTNLYHNDQQNPWMNFALRVSHNRGGAAHSLWTDIPSTPDGAGMLELATGYLLEVRAA